MAIKKVLAMPSLNGTLMGMAMRLKEIETNCREKLERLKTEADQILMANNKDKDEVWADIERWVDDKGLVPGGSKSVNMIIETEGDFLAIMAPEEPNQFEKMLKDSLRR